MLLQAPGSAEGVVGVAGGAAGSGLRAERGAQRRPAGTDASGGGAEQPEGNQPEPGPQHRSTHQPVPGITQMLAHSHVKRKKTQQCAHTLTGSFVHVDSETVDTQQGIKLQQKHSDLLQL